MIILITTVHKISPPLTTFSFVLDSFLPISRLYSVFEEICLISMYKCSDEAIEYFKIRCMLAPHAPFESTGFVGTW